MLSPDFLFPRFLVFPRPILAIFHIAFSGLQLALELRVFSTVNTMSRSIVQMSCAYNYWYSRVIQILLCKGHDRFTRNRYILVKMVICSNIIFLREKHESAMVLFSM